jgi:hypothetical protein
MRGQPPTVIGQQGTKIGAAQTVGLLQDRIEDRREIAR